MKFIATSANRHRKSNLKSDMLNLVEVLGSSFGHKKSLANQTFFDK